MKKKDLLNLKNKSIEELKRLIAEKSLEAVKLRSELSAGKHKNTCVVKNARRELAQAETILREKLGSN